MSEKEDKTNANLLVQGRLFIVVVLVVEGVYTNVVVIQFGPDLIIERDERRVSFSRSTSAIAPTNPLLEDFSLLQRKSICLGDNRNNVDDLAQLLHDSNIDRLEGVTGRGDKVETAVNSCVDDVLVSHRGELFP